jgi:hypothetical protein
MPYERGYVCLTLDELRLWRLADRRIAGQHGRSYSPCEDCTLEYAAEQRAAGKCNGTPGVPETERGPRIAA